MNFGVLIWIILMKQPKVQGQGGIDLGQGLPQDHIGQVQEEFGGHGQDRLKAKDTIHMNTLSLDIQGLEADPGRVSSQERKAKGQGQEAGRSKLQGQGQIGREGHVVDHTEDQEAEAKWE